MALTTHFSSALGEQRWVDQISKKFIREVSIDISEENPICIFNVPKSVTIFKPEAYLPQMIALGPFHHMDPDFYDMERYKISSAKWVFNQTGARTPTIKFQELLIDKIKERDHVVRGCYHSYLDFDDNTLSWIMAIDGLFLLNILQDYFVDHDQGNKKMTRGNFLSRDLLLLENQIPFVVLIEISKALKDNSSEKDELLSMMEHFCRANSPLELVSTSSCGYHAASPLHLLDFMYQLIVTPRSSETERGFQDDENVENEDEYSEDIEVVEEDIDFVCNSIDKLSKVGMNFWIGRKILKPFQVIQEMPWEKILNILGLKVFKDSGKQKGLVVQEIHIPSVSSLHNHAGITFCSTNKGIRGIMFVEEEATLYLPVITLDVNSEVVLRNLVAYEIAMNFLHSRSLFSKFVDLISGIIDDAEDARLLKEKGIIKGELTNDQIAKLFNGINKSSRNSCRTVAEINKYYKRRPLVKIFKFMKKIFFSLFKVITHLLTGFLLLLLVLYSFCQFYGCPKLFSRNS